MPKENLLERLAKGPVVGDGSLVMTLEKRGYCRTGAFTPEAVILYPEAVRQLLREYVRAGADVIQVPSFYATDGRLKRRNCSFTATEINNAACKMASEVAAGGDVLICGGLSPVHSYAAGLGDKAIRDEFRLQMDIFTKHEVDFVIAELFHYIEEMEICIDEMKSAGLPICATMGIGLAGDANGVSVEECAVRMTKAGAHVIGVNCIFDIETVLKTIKRMKVALDKEGLSPYLMCQPLGFRCLEVENEKMGYYALPDYPLSMDSRVCTRIEIHKFTRTAYEIGVRYIGGCCGMEPHHIRAIAQELSEERKKDPPVNDMCLPYGPLLKYALSSNTARKACKEYWWNIKPGSGRPFNSPCQEPQKSDILSLKST